MTPQPKTKTIGCWLVLDDHGDTWRVQCMACDKPPVTRSKGLMTGAVAPRCKCGGKVASKPQIPPPAGFVPSKPEPAGLPELDPILPFGPVDNPADKIATPPMADALFKIFGMVPVAVEQAAKPLKGERLLAQQAVQKAKSEIKRRARKAKRVRDRRKPDPKPQRQPRRFLPGDVHGAITVLREAEKVGRNRAIIGQCVCGKEWRICVQNLPKAKPFCTCIDRWRQTASNKETAARLFAERKAKRASWVLRRKVAEVDRLIHACEVRMAQLQARKAALTPPPTVAP